jgi:hypothetical protein
MSDVRVRRLHHAMVLAVATLGLGWVRPAAAQSHQDIRKIEQMNKRAMEDYDLLEFDSARVTLLKAVEMVRSSGLEEQNHPLAAKTYLNLGVVYIGGYKDKDRGRMQFVRGLRIRPDARVETQLATPELQEIFNEALREIGKKPEKRPEKRPDKPEPPPEDVETPVPADKLVHEPINDARANEPIVVKAQVGSGLGAAKVIVFYRGTGREDYIALPMTKGRKGAYSAQIPADAVTGKVLQYYIEVRDQRGRPLAGNGSGPSPNLISIVEQVGDGGGQVEVDKENPLGTKKKEETPIAGPTIRTRRFWVTVGIGTGVGVATGKSECDWNYASDPRYQGQCVVRPGDPNFKPTLISPGIASAPLHIAPEVGLYLGDRFAVSVQGRLQVLTLADKGASTGAPAFFGRGLYFFGRDRVRYYLAFAAGGGYIRHVVDIGRVVMSDAERNRSVKDTVRGGPVLFGPGAGIYYEFSSHVGLQAELNALAGVPDATFNVDLNLGVNLNF